MAIGAVSGVTDKPGLQEVEDLFREHYELVYRTAFGILHSAADAEDVLQSVFLRLVRRQVPPEVRSNVKGYFYRAAVNQSLDIIRSRRRYELVADVERLGVATTDQNPQDAERLDEQLAAALAGLKPEAVEILVLRYTHNCSDREIAQLLGMTRAAVAVRLFRSRARLRQLMRDRQGEQS